MEQRNLNRPGYVLALLLGITALVDAANAVATMQVTNICAGPSTGPYVSCGDSGWLISLLTAGFSAAFVAPLLMRPQMRVFAAALTWAVVAFLSNFVQAGHYSIDVLATYRMTVYFVVAVVAGMVVAMEKLPPILPPAPAADALAADAPAADEPAADAPAADAPAPNTER